MRYAWRMVRTKARITLPLRRAIPVELVGSFNSVMIPAIPSALSVVRESWKIPRLRDRRDRILGGEVEE